MLWGIHTARQLGLLYHYLHTLLVTYIGAGKQTGRIVRATGCAGDALHGCCVGAVFGLLQLKSCGLYLSPWVLAC